MNQLNQPIEITPGMVIGVPISETRHMRPAKVLSCSKRYRNVILVAFSDGSRDEAKAGEFNPRGFGVVRDWSIGMSQKERKLRSRRFNCA